MKLLAVILGLFAVTLLAGCNDPSADGRYATHDHGRNNHP